MVFRCAMVGWHRILDADPSEFLCMDGRREGGRALLFSLVCCYGMMHRNRTLGINRTRARGPDVFESRNHVALRGDPLLFPLPLLWVPPAATMARFENTPEEPLSPIRVVRCIEVAAASTLLSHLWAHAQKRRPAQGPQTTAMVATPSTSASGACGRT